MKEICKDCGKSLKGVKNRFIFRDHYTHEVKKYQCVECEWIDEESWIQEDE